VSSSAVSEECCKSFDERSGRHKKVPHYVDGQAIKHEKDEEKCYVDAELDKIYNEVSTAVQNFSIITYQ